VEWFYYNFTAESFHTQKFVADSLSLYAYSIELEFHSHKRQICFFLKLSLGELGVTYALHL